MYIECNREFIDWKRENDAKWRFKRKYSHDEKQKSIHEGKFERKIHKKNYKSLMIMAILNKMKCEVWEEMWSWCNCTPSVIFGKWFEQLFWRIRVSRVENRIILRFTAKLIVENMIMSSTHTGHDATALREIWIKPWNTNAPLKRYTRTFST